MCCQKEIGPGMAALIFVKNRQKTKGMELPPKEILYLETNIHRR